MKSKNKKCIKCGTRLHSTDWIILKEMLHLPICDSCLIENNDKVDPTYKKKIIVEKFTNKERLQ